MSFDLIIKNGTVILENEARVVDVAVKGGKIAAIGQDLGDAKEVMDASGLVVSPGMVDAHTSHQQRIEENFAIWDFSLTEKEMAQISSLDLGYVGESVKHFNPEFVRGCLAVKTHG